jgi:hypothetical protein
MARAGSRLIHVGEEELAELKNGAGVTDIKRLRACSSCSELLELW